jgi:hypothetical protein
MAREAYVQQVTNLIPAQTINTTPVGTVVAGVIKAKYGDFEPHYFTSKTDFLAKYTCEGKLDSGLDISFMNAYDILGYRNMVLVRARDEDYSPLKLNINGRPFTAEYTKEFGGKSACFDIKFRDFMKDKRYQVKYSLDRYAKYPGSVELKVIYEKLSEFYDYEITSIDKSASNLIKKDAVITGYHHTIGDIIDLYAVGTNEEGKEYDNTDCHIVAQVYDLDENNEYSKIKLLTSVGIADTTKFKDADGTLILNVKSTRRPNDVIKSYDIIFALGKNTVDNEGNSLYYRNIWDDNWPFEVCDVADNTAVEKTIPNPYKANDPTQPDLLTYLDYGPVQLITNDVEHGGTGPLTSTMDASDEVDDVFDNVTTDSKAWDELEQYDSRHISQYTDLGTPNIGSRLKVLAEKYHAQYCLSLPRSMESVKMAKVWGDLDLGNYRRWAGTPFAFTDKYGFRVAIAPSTQYIETVATNASNGLEWEAAAGTETGVINYGDFSRTYRKDEREALLDLKINTLTFKETEVSNSTVNGGANIINDDLTGLIINNPYKEECNFRIGIAINNQVDLIVENFKFKRNTEKFRNKLQAAINSYIKGANFVNYLADWQVICNDSNNPTSLQVQNKVAVRVDVQYYDTGKYFTIVNNVYPISESFAEE